MNLYLMNGFELKQIIDQAIKKREQDGKVYIEYTDSSEQINFIRL